MKEIINLLLVEKVGLQTNSIMFESVVYMEKVRTFSIETGLF